MSALKKHSTSENDASFLLTKVSRLMYKRELTELCGGNISMRRNNKVYITPTCASQYFFWKLATSDILILAGDGEILTGAEDHLSRETDLHLRIYSAFPEIDSVFHLHSADLLVLAEEGYLMDVELQKYLSEHHVEIAVLDENLIGQTTMHDDEVLSLLNQMDRKNTRIVIGYRHGIFSIASDMSNHFAAVDSLACFLRRQNLEANLERALSCN